MKNHLKPGLYVTATPIGNMSDITDRARYVLENADYIACEDTRVTGKLMSALGIKNTMMAFHEHNEDKQRPYILAKITEGAKIALVSDAGTPLISDPGYKLVEQARDMNLDVVPVPGPSALTAALSVAGLPTDRFMFMGFPPTKSGARQEWFANVAKLKSTLVYYESTKRLPKSLRDAASSLGDRPAAVCRELTKTFEEVIKDSLFKLVDHYDKNGAPKGECVVVVGPPQKFIQSSGEALVDIDKALKLALNHMKVKDAATFVAELSGQTRKKLYARALEIKDD